MHRFKNIYLRQSHMTFENMFAIKHTLLSYTLNLLSRDDVLFNVIEYEVVQTSDTFRQRLLIIITLLTLTARLTQYVHDSIIAHCIL